MIASLSLVLSVVGGNVAVMTQSIPGFETRTVPVDGHEVACDVAGAGPPILLLHGFRRRAWPGGR